MTVDIFGGSNIKGKKTGVNKNYVDSKFITLTKSQNLKFDKTGGIISGDIDMDGHRIIHNLDPLNIMDAANKSYVDDSISAFSHKVNGKLDISGDTMQGDLNMNHYKITNVVSPIINEDAANKRYVDQRYDSLYDSLTGLLKKLLAPNSVGLIPILTEKNDKSGYVVEESSKLNDNHGYNAFRMGRAWRVANDVTTDFWLKIKLPRQERVNRISIKAVDDTKIKKWELQGRNIDDNYHPWIVIPFINEDDLVIQHSTRIFEAQLQDTDDYRFYRLYIHDSEGRNPGLSHLQFYTLNKILYYI